MNKLFTTLISTILVLNFAWCIEETSIESENDNQNNNSWEVLLDNTSSSSSLPVNSTWELLPENTSSSSTLPTISTWQTLPSTSTWEPAPTASTWATTSSWEVSTQSEPESISWAKISLDKTYKDKFLWFSFNYPNSFWNLKASSLWNDLLISWPKKTFTIQKTSYSWTIENYLDWLCKKYSKWSSELAKCSNENPPSKDYTKNTEILPWITLYSISRPLWDSGNIYKYYFKSKTFVHILSLTNKDDSGLTDILKSIKF